MSTRHFAVAMLFLKHRGGIWGQAMGRHRPMEENQRVRLSKRLLKEGLIELLSQKSIHKISVTEICRKSQINRTTFYKHYASQYELFRDIENDILSGINDAVSGHGGPAGGAMEQCFEIVSYINDNIDICRIVFENNIYSEFSQKLFSMPHIQRGISRMEQEQGPDNALLEYICTIVFEGVFAMIRRWLAKKDRESVEIIANALSDVIIKLIPIPQPDGGS
jgi:AcrR family transcriptional regulator